MTKGKDQPQAYGDETYWDNRYSQDAGTFDWYQRYAGLAPLINMYIPKQNKILMVGCGNADQRMDVRDMKAFKDGQFDTVLDKGMLDSLMCGASATYSASSMLQEVRRVLKPGGVYLLITYGDPRVRLPHLKAGNFLWEVVLHVIPRPGSRRTHESTSRLLTDPVILNNDLMLGPLINTEDPDLHYVYVCIKEAGLH
ncbi:hypothetical protein BDL97_13G044000 [Sphagnum fallax]|nr:hypothetical protein BDL97_13G044000 [Sphagnum fallax]KAH8943286.1 hypothetical protein BDL97_13G044000 [Sphagnum fallax]